MDLASPPESRLLLLGTARLPKTAAGDEYGVLMIELTLDSENGSIVDVATTVPLPGYGALLRRLLIGCSPGEVAGAVEKLSAQLRGPLLRPTIAALASALSNNCRWAAAPLSK